MRGPSLQKTALLSFSLHLTAFLLIFLILRQSNHIVIPSPYTVNLVSPNVLRMNKGKIENIVKESEETAAPLESPEKSRKEAAKEKEFVEKKIAALQQKENVEKKISDLEAKKNKIDMLAKHHEIISVKAGVGHGVQMSSAQVKRSDEYGSKIKKEIEPHFYLPPRIINNKELEAIIAVRILKDGRVIVQGIEKKSGNAFFDRAAIRALAEASPLTPPPYEMEIGLTFHP